MCKWVVGEGRCNTYWAFTPCKKGFNYLSKARKVTEIKPQYEHHKCPICGELIELNLELVN